LTSATQNWNPHRAEEIRRDRKVVAVCASFCGPAGTPAGAGAAGLDENGMEMPPELREPADGGGRNKAWTVRIHQYPIEGQCGKGLTSHRPTPRYLPKRLNRVILCKTKLKVSTLCGRRPVVFLNPHKAVIIRPAPMSSTSASAFAPYQMLRNTDGNAIGSAPPILSEINKIGFRSLKPERFKHIAVSITTSAVKTRTEGSAKARSGEKTWRAAAIKASNLSMKSQANDASEH